MSKMFILEFTDTGKWAHERHITVAENKEYALKIFSKRAMVDEITDDLSRPYTITECEEDEVYVDIY